MSDCGPALWATRSRRCFNSAIRSLSSNTGGGGVSLMLAATGLSAFARTETSAGLSIANAAKKASAKKAARVVLEFLIYLLLLTTKTQTAQIGFFNLSIAFA